MRVPFFDYPALYSRDKKELNDIFDDVCSRGAYILQRDLEEFETNLASFLGVKHAIGLADGTNAISLGLKACNMKPGDEIIMSSHTYVATAAAVHQLGGIPVFADIGADSMLSPEKAEKKITNRTKAIMPTQLNGRCCDMSALETICKKYDLDLYEDAAQGLGASFDNKMAGTFGKFGTVSFYPAKVLGCLGDGGALFTNDDGVAEFVRLYRDHGRNDNGDVVAWGTNCRLDNLNAAILNFKLKNYKQDIKRRRGIAAMYIEGLNEIAEITLPPAPGQQRNFDVFQNFEASFERRDELKTYLANQGVSAIPQWGGKPVHHFEALGFGKEHFNDLAQTDKFFERCLMLPLNMAMSDEQVYFVIDNIKRFYQK